MLSVLIPVYNFNCLNLVEQIHSQCKLANIVFEIYLIDDKSTAYFKNINDALMGKSNCIYEELQENIGRSKIRNLLAKKAKYENLLFLDCDSKITSPDFIKKYSTYFGIDQVVYGGRNYESKPPFDENLFLRWIVGVKRETISCSQRKKNKYINFLSNNFLIPKKNFEIIQFDETLVGYGHEDTLFASNLNKNKINIEHIDNPLCHIGLETNTVFLAKTEEGLKNLYAINKKIPNAVSDVRIITIINFLESTYLEKLTEKVLALFEKKIKKNLLSKYPNLILFDI
jgi:Glycosyl transferase family 2